MRESKPKKYRYVPLENDPFIGKTFGNSNQVKVTERLNGCYYKVVCSECAKDSEMFGEASFVTAKDSLEKQWLPCGCGRNFYRSREQWEIEVKRICAIENYEFMGFIGDNITGDSKVKLKCLADGNIWDTTRVKNVLAGTRCPKCKLKNLSLAKSKQDNEHIEEIRLTGIFPETTMFWKSTRKDAKGTKSYWYSTCEVCFNDEITQSGLCSGIFESSLSSLKKGNKPCRCNKVSWTEETLAFKIEKMLIEEGGRLRLVGFPGGYTNMQGYCSVNCWTHGDYKVKVNNLINGSRCPLCADTGFKESGDSYVYVLKIIGEAGGFTGYGITGNTKHRFKEHRKYLKKFGFSIKSEFITLVNGEFARGIESGIKQSFERYPQQVKGFKEEATYLYNYNKVCEYVRNREELRY